MNRITGIYRRQRGSVLLAVLCFLFLAVGLVVSILPLSTSHRLIAQEQLDMERAMYVAEAGVERSANYISAHFNFMPALTNSTGNVGLGSYQAVITQINRVTYSIVSTGTVNGVKHIISLWRIYQPTYAEFALWSHVNGAIYFTYGDVFNGHVHADDQLYFNTSGNNGPVFHAECTSLASTYSIQGSISACEFDKGLQLNSYQGTMADVDFNSASPNSLKNLASSAGGLVLQGTSTITFSGSTMQITNTRMSWSNHVYDPPNEGLIYVQNATSGSSDTPGRVYLQAGTLTGRLTIVTEEDMYIKGNLMYTTDPATNSTSADALGLISNGDVWVDTSAPNNLQIHAAIMATGEAGGSGNPGSFGVVNYNSGNPRGTLTIYGGIVQEVRGAVGTIGNGGTIATGFAKNYSYDPRYLTNPPPYYPAVSGKLVYSNWQDLP